MPKARHLFGCGKFDANINDGGFLLVGGRTHEPPVGNSITALGWKWRFEKVLRVQVWVLQWRLQQTPSNEIVNLCGETVGHWGFHYIVYLVLMRQMFFLKILTLFLNFRLFIQVTSVTRCKNKKQSKFPKVDQKVARKV